MRAGLQPAASKVAAPASKGVALRKPAVPSSVLTAVSLQPGIKVWIPNPYDEDAQSPKYRSLWLPAKVCGRPVWVPGSIVSVRGMKPVHYASISAEDLPSIELDIITELEPQMKLTLTADEVQMLNSLPPLQTSDLCDVDDINQATVITSILARHMADAVYTRAGPCLVAVNPYRVVLDRNGDSIVDPVYMYRYKDRVSVKLLNSLPPSKRAKLILPPHVFEVADAALNTLKSDQLPQCIVVSGESGSGKSEAAKMLLGFLAAASADVSRPSSTSKRPLNTARDRARRGPIGCATNPLHMEHLFKAEAQLLLSSAIIDAFGNARTGRNDNSSRFGRLCKLLFDRDGAILGWSVSTFMFERARLTQHAQGERTFHALYYLLAGASDELRTELGLLEARQYKYLCYSSATGAASSFEGSPAGFPKASARAAGGASGDASGAVPSIPGVNDADEFLHLHEMMTVAGLSAEFQKLVWKLLAAVLTLGNIRFEGEDTAAVANPLIARHAASLLGVSSDGLVQALTTAAAGGEGSSRSKLAPLTADAADRLRDDAARWLYSRIFNMLIQQCNRLGVTYGGEDVARSLAEVDSMTVSVLDAWGFESSLFNSLDQLSANYCHERVEMLFTDVLFKHEMDVYRAEGITCSELVYCSNQDVIDLMENPVSGIISQLQEVCLFPRPNDRTLLSKLNSTHSRRSAAFGQPDKRSELNHFVICHAAGSVSYCVDGMVNKNREKPAVLLEALIRSSVHSAVASLAPEASGATASTLTMSKYKEDIVALIDALRVSQLHFVRCIRPNSLKQASYIEPEDVLNQVQHLQLMEVLHMSRYGFSYQSSYSEFFDRFIIIAQPRIVIPSTPREEIDFKPLCEQLLHGVRSNEVFAGADLGATVQFGTTRIFLKADAIRGLEAIRELRLVMMDNVAVRVQAVVRGRLIRKRMKAMLEGFAVLQAAWRTKVIRELWLQRNWAAKVIQSTVRTHQSAKWYAAYLQAIARVQRWARAQARIRAWRRLRSGVRALHILARGYIVRVHVASILSSASLLQRVIRTYLARNRLFKLHDSSARKLQSVWKGFKFRVNNEDLMDFLSLRRVDRAREASVRKFQALWRSVLIWRRFRQVRNAAATIQRFFLMKLHRDEFQKQQVAVKKIQSVARGYISREQVRRLRTLQSVADELWRLQKVREREFMEVSHLNSDTAASRRSYAAFTTGAHRPSTPEFKLLDVDVIMDNSDVFPRGWTQLFAELQAELYAMNTRAVAICPGSTHCVVLAESGQVYSWGWGDRGQCGHGVLAGERKPRLISALSEAALAADRSGEQVEAFSLTRGPVVPTRIKMICTGEEHTLALTDHGTVYSWGCGKRGQLGHGDSVTIATPTIIESLKRKVSVIAAGSHHSVFLLAAGSVFTCGSGKQLGLGVFTGNGDQHTPQPVKSLAKRRMKGIAAGAGFSLALSGEGDLFGWGNNKDGQLGVGDTKDRLIPFVIAAFHADPKHSRVVMMSCGSRHAGAVTSSGRLYMWGDSSYGQLGLDDTVPRHVPTHVTCFASHKVSQLVCGARSTTVITETNEAVTWGMSSSVAADAARSVAVLEGKAEASQVDVFFQTASPLEIAMHTLPGRTLKRVIGGFSHTMSVTGILYVQAAVNMQGELCQAAIVGSKTTTGKAKPGDLSRADPARRALAKLHPLLSSPGLASAASASGEAKAGYSHPMHEEKHQEDSFGAYLRSRTLSSGAASSVSSLPVMNPPLGRSGAAAAGSPVSASPLALMAVLPAGAALPSRSPQLSASIQKALSLLPPQKLKHVTAEQLRVLAREVDAAPSGLVSTPTPKGNVIASFAAARPFMATPGTPGSPSASSARGPGPDKKALRVAQAKARRLVEDDDRRAWRAERELRGKNQAGPDLNALFDTRTILRSSALDNEASSDKLVLASPPLASRKHDAMQGLMFSSAASKGGAPAPASGPPVSKRGLTVREMLSSGAMLLAPPSGSVQNVASSLLLPTAPQQPEASAAVSASGDFAEAVQDAASVQEAVSASAPSRTREPESLESVLASIKRRAAAQVDALWYKSAGKAALSPATP